MSEFEYDCELTLNECSVEKSITFGEPLLSGCLLFYWLDIPYANIFLISLLWANITYQLAYLN